ncbi:hypothetical protein Clacol_002025 [Clathrus columnatus]|uniref:Deoxyuridine 5'-triphosphate nucleotidohydrolase n=1 Tax=Clathrus columnatus TaxID=1419009 RepID=A0AAV5A484_9AGAM|nr:hypothetical protein Clacol_002025 [Clathrus columnatus]
MTTTAPLTNLLVKCHSENARIPQRGSSLSAGYDLFSAEEKIVQAKGKALIDTQISIAVPFGTYGRVAPRSGLDIAILASKFMIDTGAGQVTLYPFKRPRTLTKDLTLVSVGDRVAQLIIEKIETPEVLQVDDLDKTLRGAGGFGSTGGYNGL